MTPGNDPRLLTKQAGSGADVALIDLEDSVPDSARAAARAHAADALAGLDWGGKERLVRTRSWEAGAADDIEAVAGARPDGVLLAKVRASDEVQQAARLLDRLDPGGGIALWCMVETARALLDVERIVLAPRLGGLLMGTGDLSLDLGFRRLGLGAAALLPEFAELGLDLLYARSRVVAAARAAGIAAIDVSITALDDLAAVERKALLSFQLGFDGKMVITPSHIPAVHRAFGPSPDDIRWAERVVSAFEGMEARGEGSAVVDGEPVDGPYLPHARAILERAAAVAAAER